MSKRTYQAAKMRVGDTEYLLHADGAVYARPTNGRTLTRVRNPEMVAALRRAYLRALAEKREDQHRKLAALRETVAAKGATA